MFNLVKVLKKAIFKIKNSVKYITNFYKNLSIKNKLLLVLYVQISIPIFLVGYMSYSSSVNIINVKSSNYSMDLLRMIKLRIEDYEKNMIVISQNLLYEKDLYSVLEVKELEENESSSKIEEYQKDIILKNILKKIILSHDEISSIAIIPKSTNNLYSVDSSTEKVSIKSIMPDLKELKKYARLGEGRVIWYVDTNKNDDEAKRIYVLRTIYNFDNFNEIGLMVILLKNEFIETLYKDLLTDTMQNIIIFSDNYKNVISMSNIDKYVLREIDYDEMDAKTGFIINREKSNLISYTKLNVSNWSVVSHMKLKDLYKDNEILKQNIIILSIISILILSILSVYIAVDFMKPINSIMNAMETLETGESNVYIKVERKDELGFLQRSFNKMSKEINNLVNWIYREQITRKEAEIRALQSQINPHFLFNTLESINWMAQLNNIPQISGTVSDLASLMEASMGRGNKLITLDEEFKYAEKYISLLNRRFAGKIELVKDIEEELLDVKVPKLLIQPLVENAIFHGIERIKGKGIVNLNAYLNDGIIIIEVIDNGIGINPEKLKKINTKLSMSNNTYFKQIETETNKSIGIENVNRRIKLFYGDEYGLEIVSIMNKYTKVYVKFPLIKDRDEV